MKNLESVLQAEHDIIAAAALVSAAADEVDDLFGDLADNDASWEILRQKIALMEAALQAADAMPTQSERDSVSGEAEALAVEREEHTVRFDAEERLEKLKPMTIKQAATLLQRLDDQCAKGPTRTECHRALVLALRLAEENVHGDKHA